MGGVVSCSAPWDGFREYDIARQILILGTSLSSVMCDGKLKLMKAAGRGELDSLASISYMYPASFGELEHPKLQEPRE